MKRCLTLMLLLSIMMNGCAVKQGEEAENETEEEVSVIETEEEESIVENEKFIEPETFTGKSTDTMSFCLNAAELKPEQTWTLGNHKVYFGQFEGNAVAYRVLPNSPDTQTLESGKDYLFLDCDSVLVPKEYDADNQKNEGQTKRQNEWKGSDLEEWLNGNDFYENSAMFSEPERDAIVRTELTEIIEAYATGKWTYQDSNATNYIFILSAAEANQLYVGNTERAKNGSNTSWWLRSSFAEAGQGAGAIHADGHICNNSVMNFSNGVCPAMNIDFSKVLFASCLKGEMCEEKSTIWKLTLLDTDKSINIVEGQAPIREEKDEGTVITIPYTYTGDSVTHISVMITDEEYPAVEAQVLFYGNLRGVDISRTSGTGNFVLPAELEEQICGTGYHAYIIAEDVNADKRTDYASEPCEIMIPIGE